MTDDTPRTKPNLWEYIGYSYVGAGWATCDGA
jgi:hypothetical protein